jgi:hypothetical protein
MGTFIAKIIALIPLLSTSVLGLAQAIVKVLKELATSIVNLIFPFTPDNGKFELAVMKVRAFIDKLDGWIEKGKSALLKLAGISI